MKQIWYLLLFVVGVTACNNTRSTTPQYYPVDSLVTAQIKLLTSVQAKLTKKAHIDGKEEVETYIPKSDTAWAHELDIFTQLNDINKPTNVGKYRIETGLKDTNSNLLIYSLQSTETLPIVYYKVYYLHTRSEIRKIEALYSEESSLLDTSRKLTMEFQNINNKIVLTSYSIAGGQKMLLADSVTFSVSGSITLP